MIPLNQLIPECLLALGGAFLLGNLAAYIRLRPAWREAKRARGGRVAKQATQTVANGQAHASATPEAGALGAGGTEPSPGRPGTERRHGASPSSSGATRAGTARTVGADSGVSKTRVTKAVDPKSTGSISGVSKSSVSKSGGSKPAGGKQKATSASSTKLPSRARVLANVVVGLVITVAALATLIRG